MRQNQRHQNIPARIWRKNKPGHSEHTVYRVPAGSTFNLRWSLVGVNPDGRVGRTRRRSGPIHSLRLELGTATVCSCHVSSFTFCVVVPSNSHPLGQPTANASLYLRRNKQLTNQPILLHNPILPLPLHLAQIPIRRQIPTRQINRKHKVKSDLHTCRSASPPCPT